MDQQKASNDTLNINIDVAAEQLSDDKLDLVVGGIGTVIPSGYHHGDGNGEAAFYAGTCMGLMGF